MANRIRQAIVDFKRSNLAEKFFAEALAKERVANGDIAGYFI
jgi:hypothetical protein